MSLEEYRRRRDFSHSPEPSGEGARDRPVGGLWDGLAHGHRFCVQMHRATRLHYDLRLEHGGVLLSWAVPRGPSLDPRSRRLAVQTEDHPVDYGDFEGVIPSGYGMGAVELWDAGTFEWVRESAADPDAQIARGDIKFRLQGRKLGGEYALVALRRPVRSGGDRTFLLIKKKDRWAVSGHDAAGDDRSVRSGRTLAQIAAEGGGDPREARRAHRGAARSEAPGTLDRERRTSPPGTAGGGRGHLRPRGGPPPERTGAAARPAGRPPAPREAESASSGASPGAVAGPAPAPGGLPAPMLATAAARPFSGEGWLFELKYDGIRVIAAVDGAEVRLRGRRGRLGALVLAVRAGDGWSLCGAVGAGIGEQAAADLLRRLEPLRRPAPGIAGRLRSAEPVRWSEPQLVCEVRHAGWTGAGLLRHPAYLGLRPDLAPEECVREAAGEAPRAEHGDPQGTGDAGLTRAEAAGGTRPAMDASPRRGSPRRRRSRQPEDPAVAEALDVLARLGGDAWWQIGERRLRLTHLDKPMWPDPVITKREMVDYYVRMAPHLLPHLRDRPLSTQVFPDGISGHSFWREDQPGHAPEWIDSWVFRGESATTRWIVAREPATLGWLANAGSSTSIRGTRGSTPPSSPTGRCSTSTPRSRPGSTTSATSRAW